MAVNSQDPLPSSGPTATIGRRYALYALLVIFAANFLSYLDRQVVAGLEKELSNAFGFADFEYALLHSVFTIGYIVFAPLIAFLAGRAHRPRVLAGCVLIWSLATMWSGRATFTAELLTARFLIGIGEAGCLVIGPTLIADYFAKESRGAALSVFFLGLPFGGTVGYAVAALGQQYMGGWRNAFLVAGLPGLGLAVLTWLLIDPPRGGEEIAGHHGHGGGKVRGIRPYLALFKNETLRWIILAQAFAVVTLIPLLLYGVKFLEDHYKVEKLEASLSIGLISLIAGSLGNLTSGLLGDWLNRRVRGAYSLLAGIAYLFATPCMILAFTAPTIFIMQVWLFFGAYCFFICMPAVNTQIANAVAAPARAMAYALAAFILHIGDMVAPLGFRRVELFWDRQSTFVLFSCSLLLAGGSALLAMRSARRDELLAEGPPPGQESDALVEAPA